MSRLYDIELFRGVSPCLENIAAAALSSKNHGIALALLLVACGISASLIFLAFGPPVMIFAMNSF